MMTRALNRALVAVTTLGLLSVLVAALAKAAFTDIGAGLPAGWGGSVAWGDYDNDGDLDILLTGNTLSGPFSRIYRNDDGAFADIGAGLQGVYSGSVAWGDYDNDGDLDVLLTGFIENFGFTSRVYRNDGGVFTDIDAGLPGVGYSSVAWGDYDRDGDLDILMTGMRFDPFSRVYRNDGGTFTDIGAGLPGVNHGSVAWGDYDNDGNLDILLTGDTDSSFISRVYRNVGGAFADIGAGLPGVATSSVAWGDYDGDGDLDILLTGSTGSVNISRVYRNDGGAFTDIDAGLPGVNDSSVAWGDCDNDGDLDILLTGGSSSGDISRVYRNDGGTFVDLGATLPGVYATSVAWGDYDNDGDLDIVLTGTISALNYISGVYRNDGAPANTPPTAPTNLTATYLAGTAILSWDAAADAETPAAGLSYNLRVGTTPGGGEILSGMADAVTGYRRVVALGNAQQRTSWGLTLPAGAYFWSVQAVDGAWAGGPFAEEAVVRFIGFTEVGAGLPGVSNGSVAWGDYDHDGDLDILATGYTVSWTLASYVYRNDGGVFTDLGAGLPGVSAGSAAWGDYDNDGDLDILLTGLSDSSVISRIYRNDGGTFADLGADLPGVLYGSVAWGDCDNDGDLDVLLTGSHSSGIISRVYRNDGGTFTDIGAGLAGVLSGDVAWGDYDNDGDLDILLSGYVGPDSFICRIYRNDGGLFTDIGAGLPGVNNSSVAWGDHDNDGDLDILLTGDTGSERISSVYRNDGGVFTDIGAGLQGVRHGSAAWGDYDNDGDLDVLLTGDAGTSSVISRVARVYRNDNGLFTDIGAGLPGAYLGSVSWGDYDNDGDLDILLTGDTTSGRIARIYRNDGALANTPPAAPTNLEAEFAAGTATFSWDAAMDAQTPAAGLSYNLRVGTTPGGGEILSGMADGATGYRQVVAVGNAQQRTLWALTLPAGDCYWSVQAIDAGFAGSLFATASTTTGVRDDAGEMPWAFALRSATPNPFNPQTTIHYDLPRAARVHLGVYDVAGRLVRTLAAGQEHPAGRQAAVWNGRDETGCPAPSGVYFCRLDAGDCRATIRMALVK